MAESPARSETVETQSTSPSRISTPPRVGKRFLLPSSTHTHPLGASQTTTGSRPHGTCNCHFTPTHPPVSWSRYTDNTKSNPFHRVTTGLDSLLCFDFEVSSTSSRRANRSPHTATRRGRRSCVHFRPIRTPLLPSKPGCAHPTKIRPKTPTLLTHHPPSPTSPLRSLPQHHTTPPETRSIALG